MQEEPDEDSQCLSDDTDTEISTQVCIIAFFFPLYFAVLGWGRLKKMQMCLLG